VNGDNLLAKAYIIYLALLGKHNTSFVGTGTNRQSEAGNLAWSKKILKWVDLHLPFADGAGLALALLLELRTAVCAFHHGEIPAAFLRITKKKFRSQISPNNQMASRY
jgi:hypothetical protein